MMWIKGWRIKGEDIGTQVGECLQGCGEMVVVGVRLEERQGGGQGLGSKSC